MPSSGWCEKCDQRVGITPTGEPIAKSSSRYWRLNMHPIRGPIQEVCEGSGQKI